MWHWERVLADGRQMVTSLHGIHHNSSTMIHEHWRQYCEEYGGAERERQRVLGGLAHQVARQLNVTTHVEQHVCLAPRHCLSVARRYHTVVEVVPTACTEQQYKFHTPPHHRTVYNYYRSRPGPALISSYSSGRKDFVDLDNGWPYGVMVRAFESQLRSRRFDSWLYHCQVTT